MKENMKEKQGFIISRTIKESWEIFKKEWIIIYALNLLPMIIGFGYGMFTGGFDAYSGDGSFNFVAYLIYMVLQIIISMGVVKGLLAVTRGKKIDLDTFTSVAPVALKYIAAQILMVLIIIGGLLLFIVPGIYFSIKYMFAPYLVIDKGLGPIEALKESGRLTKGVKWDIIAFMFAAVALLYSGILALGVGLIISIPVASLSYVVFYNKLLKRIE